MINEKTPSIIVFDVNETLLDITSLNPLFIRLFGDECTLREWFAQLILYSQTMTLSGVYTSFSDLGVAIFQMVANIHQVKVLDQDILELTERLSTMPAHPDVVPALVQLRDAGFRLVTLSNSTSNATLTSLENAGINHFFERNFSIETVGKFKPAPECYNMVAEALIVETSDLCLVACHLWDVIGAQAAGCRSAFLVRPQNAIFLAPNIPMPHIVASELNILVDHIILGG
jgi:2-haloacid dehalogenase